MKCLICIVAVAALGTAGCGKSKTTPSASTGPIDGTYVLQAKTCDNLTLPDKGWVTHFVIKGTTGTQSDLLPDNCTIVTVSSLGFSTADSKVTVTPIKFSCGNSCTGGDCTPSDSLPPAATYKYNKEPQTLLLTPDTKDPSCSGPETIAYGNSS